MSCSKARAAVLGVVLLSLTVARLDAAPAAAASLTPAPTGPPASLVAPGTTESGSSPYPLEGTRWRLAGYSAGDGIRPNGPEVVATLQLRNGRARGQAGCNAIRAAYLLAVGADAGPTASPSLPEDGQQPDPATTFADGWTAIDFDGIDIGDAACAAGSSSVEQFLLDGLDGAASYRIDPGQAAWQAVLTFRDAANLESLEFRVDDAGSLKAGRWLLESIAGTPTGSSPDESGGPDTSAILAFDPGARDRAAGHSTGRVTGSTGCNSFSGGYTAQGRVLSIEHLRVSEVDCAPNLQAQEAAVLAVLTEPSLLIELPPGRLVIMAPGSSAGLEYVTTAPLEGPTWLLTSLRGHRLDPRDVVTLRLKDGHVSGEAPCGAYTGAYDTNGVLISMAGLAASTGACPLSALERAYLHALRRAAFLALEGPTLRLHDAGGRTVARFLQPGSP